MGVLHPEFLPKRLTSRHVSEWMAYSQLEPFGERHRDMSFGILGALVANMFRGSDKPAYGIEKFMVPTWEARQPKQPKKQTAEQIKSVLRMFRDGIAKKASKPKKKKGS